MNEGIEVISPDAEQYDQVSATVRQRNEYNIDYNELAENYNKAQVGSILLIKAGLGIRTNNVISVIKNRGLEYKVDFQASKLTKDTTGSKIAPENRPIAIVKVTDTQMAVR